MPEEARTLFTVCDAYRVSGIVDDVKK